MSEEVLGPSQEKIIALFREKREITINDVVELGFSRKTAQNHVLKLLKKRVIIRVRKGCYMMVRHRTEEIKNQ